MKSEMMLRSRSATDLNSVLANLFTVNSASVIISDSALMTDLTSVTDSVSVIDSDSTDSDSTDLLSALQISVSLILMMKTERTAVVMIFDDFTKASKDTENEMNVKEL